MARDFQIAPKGGDNFGCDGTENSMSREEDLKSVVEAILYYVGREPITLEALSQALHGVDADQLENVLRQLVEEYQSSHRGIEIRRVAGGYKFGTKPQHHEAIRRLVKSLIPPVKLSRPAMETLAVIAYRQPVTLPEIQEIRGVDAAGVIKNLLEKKLIVPAGRKQVVGRPILYKTTRDFLLHFGLNDLDELPSLEEFEELARMSLSEEPRAEESATNPQNA